MSPQPFFPEGDTEIESVWRTRARALAQPLPLSEGYEPQEASIEVLEFRIANERYAVETGYVSAVLPLRNLTEIPCTPPFVLGAVNLRGRVVTVVDLKEFFRLPEQGLTDLHRIVLIANDETEFGLLADVSVGIHRIKLSTLQTSLPSLSKVGERYVKGVSADGVIVLETGRILDDPEMLVNEKPADGA